MNIFQNNIHVRKIIILNGEKLKIFPTSDNKEYKVKNQSEEF